MNILLVSPSYPDTFWSFKHALKFVSKRASFPPLGLITVASMLPSEWMKRLVDMNVEALTDEHLRWADFVFISAMSIQKQSAMEVIGRCKAFERRVVAGGPLFTAHPDDFPEVDHLVLNEAELTLPRFLRDIESGTAKHCYTSSEWANVQTTPIPLWNLIRHKYYSSLNIQYSRGCPYDCEFCDITVLYGRVPRTKSKEQIIAELDALLDAGWKGDVFFVDDNFIGNKAKLKKDILPAVIAWMKAHRHPFALSTEVSVNLADDEELMQMMVDAGFDMVFVGIESPNEESLLECKKIPNKHRDLLESVRTIQRKGLRISGGFILGFDNDPAAIFDRLATFIQESGIITAMVGLLNAPRGTRLYKRLHQEGRLLSTFTGDNTDFSMNFVPKMDAEALREGYRKVLRSIYAPKQYYARVRYFLKDFAPPRISSGRFKGAHVIAFFKSILLLGVIGKERIHYWKLFFWSLCTRPRIFRWAITFAIYGFHFRKIFEQELIG